MDANLIFTTVLGILGQPLVKKAAQAAIEKAAEAAGQAGGEGVINTLLKFLRKDGQERALSDAAKAPEEEKFRDQLLFQIQQLIKHHPNFLNEIKDSIENQPENIRNEQIMRGNNLINVKQIMSGEGGRMTMDAHGDIKGGIQDITVNSSK